MAALQQDRAIRAFMCDDECDDLDKARDKCQANAGCVAVYGYFKHDCFNQCTNPFKLKHNLNFYGGTQTVFIKPDPTTTTTTTLAPVTPSPVVVPVVVPDSITKAPGLTDLEQAGIAVGTVAGVGIIAAGIAASQMKPVTKEASAEGTPVDVPVLAGGRLYKMDGKSAIATKVGNGAFPGVLMGVAAFVFLGCFFLGISGVIYTKSRKNRSTRSIIADSLQEEQDAESLLAE